MNKHIMCRGKEYPTFKAIAKAYNLSYQTVIARARRGLTDDALVCLPDARHTHDKAAPAISVVVEGRTYKSLGQLARAYGIKPGLVHWRYRQGIRGKDLVISAHQGNCKSIEVGGKIYTTLKDLALAFGLSPSTVRSRWYAGARGDALVTSTNHS